MQIRSLNNFFYPFHVPYRATGIKVVLNQSMDWYGNRPNPRTAQWKNSHTVDLAISEKSPSIQT